MSSRIREMQKRLEGFYKMSESVQEKIETLHDEARRIYAEYVIELSHEEVHGLDLLMYKSRELYRELETWASREL